VDLAVRFRLTQIQAYGIQAIACPGSFNNIFVPTLQDNIAALLHNLEMSSDFVFRQRFAHASKPRRWKMLDDYIFYASRFTINNSQDITAAVDMELYNLLSPLATIKQVEPTIIEKSMGRKRSLYGLRA
jgi:hypothetical protein